MWGGSAARSGMHFNLLASAAAAMHAGPSEHKHRSDACVLLHEVAGLGGSSAARVLHCELALGIHAGKTVLIPSIRLQLYKT
eukprot:365968-Chlamydomonas_euryale.AAC.1